MFKFFKKSPATSEVSKSNEKPSTPEVARANPVYVNEVIKHSLNHVFKHKTFIGSLNNDPDFVTILLPDGVAFASNAKQGVSALQEQVSTGIMFAHVPLASVALVSAPSAIAFNLYQEPQWRPTATDKDGNISEFRAEIVIDNPDHIVRFSFAAASGNTRLTPNSSDVLGTIMTIAVRVELK